MDINMPGMDGIQASEMISQTGPEHSGRDDVRAGRSGLFAPLDVGGRTRSF